MRSVLVVIATISACAVPAPSSRPSVDEPTPHASEAEEPPESGDSVTPPDRPGSDDSDDSDLTEGVVAPLPPRPLCLEEPAASAAPPQFPADLADWVARVRGSDNFLWGRDPLARLDALGDAIPDTQDGLVTLLERGWERLKFGRLDDAIADLDRAEALAITLGDAPRRATARQALTQVWLRRAEIDNCITQGQGTSCLAPFATTAHHTVRLGMETVDAIVRRHADEDDASHLGMRWAINVARMALGDWPAAVRDDLRIEAARLTSELPAAPWVNLTHDTPLGATPTLAGGATIDDIDGDGLLDIVTSDMGLDGGFRVLLSVGDGTFCDASNASGLARVPGILHFVPADIDNDGDLDLIAPRGAWLGTDGRIRPSLLINDGAGRFTDNAVAAGLADTVGPSQVVAVADVDGDGWLDIYLGRERNWRGSAYPASLYLNQQDGTFVDAAAGWGIDTPRFVKGAAFGDIDGDRDPDLYVSVFGGDNVLYRNTGTGFEPILDAPVAQPTHSFATWFFDVEQDGDLDLFVAAYPESALPGNILDPQFGRGADAFVEGLLGLHEADATPRLYRNDAGTFTDVTDILRLGRAHAVMGASVGDLDADGLPDLYLGNGAPGYEALEPNTMLLNRGSTGFFETTTDARVGHLQKGHGVAIGDLDEDGDLDMLAEVGGVFEGDAFPDALFLNPLEDVPSLTIDLEGMTSNRDAIGARVRVTVGWTTRHYAVGAVSSFGSHSRRITAPLPAGTTGDVRVEIDWPSGATETVTAASAGHVIRIVEGQGKVATRPLRRMDLAPITP